MGAGLDHWGQCVGVWEEVVDFRFRQHLMVDGGVVLFCNSDLIWCSERAGLSKVLFVC